MIYWNRFRLCELKIKKYFDFNDWNNFVLIIHYVKLIGDQIKSIYTHKYVGMTFKITHTNIVYDELATILRDHST